MLDQTTLDANISSMTSNIQHIESNIQTYLQKEKGLVMPVDSKIINNSSFYEGLNVITFLSRVGKHLRMSSMLSKDSVASRLEKSGMSFTEFSY